VAGGSGADLRAGEEKLPPAQARSRHARDAPWDLRCSRGRGAVMGPVWTTEHRFHRAGSTDGASWRGGSGTPHLGHGEACPTTAGSLGMVAGLLSFRAPPRITTDSARAAARARRQVGSATLPAAHSSHGSREKHPTVVNAGSPVLSFATTAMLHNVSGYKARRRPVK
jgi:hypothetical protein